MNWWLWSAWIEDPDKSTRPLYGFLAETLAPTDASTTSTKALPSKSLLHISERVLTKCEATSLQDDISNRSNLIDLTAFFPDAPRFNLQAYRHIVCSAFGHSAAKATCGYTSTSPEELFPYSEDLETLLEHLSQLLGLPFKGSHALHFGGFDYFQLDSWLDGVNPYGTSVINRTTGLQPNLIKVWRNESVGLRQVVHLQAKANDETLHEGAHFLEPGVASLEIEIPSPLDAYELSIFDDPCGAVRYRESTTMMMEVSIASHTFGRVVQHRDRVEAKAAISGDKDLHQRAGSTTAVHTVRSLVNVDSTGLRQHHIALRKKLDELLPFPSQDRWFPITSELGLGVIAHLDSLLSGSRTQEAIIVDPFFGEEALQTVATRFTNTDLKLTVVASWGKSDPDTGDRIEGTTALRRSYAQRRLEPIFGRIAPLINVQFRFVNVVTSDGAPAFHDRYLFLKLHDGATEIYLLSNSLNKLASKWPFCMSLLTGKAKIEATRYVKGLVEGKDVTRTTDPTTSYRWVSPYFQRS